MYTCMPYMYMIIIAKDFAEFAKINFYQITIIIIYNHVLLVINLGPCLAQPCSNGGTCNDLGASYNCTCAIGWVGLNCADAGMYSFCLNSIILVSPAYNNDITACKITVHEL